MPDEEVIELPLVKITKEDLYGILLVFTDNIDELYRDALIKLQTWIMNYAEEQVSGLYDSEYISESDVESIKKKICVISPITIALYLEYGQKNEKKKDVEKERGLLEKFPERFKARFKDNFSNRNAREVDVGESDANIEKSGEGEEDVKGWTFVEFLKFLRDTIN